ncbi:uncharacterized protein LOC143185125 [Calliopsis andreniformis]|uniref:uncharacterized protein LOC143185125 n=1 Tax=Calliopsis andreniformis TaxID=337506 RepID=UPI003FCED79C
MPRKRTIDLARICESDKARVTGDREMSFFGGALESSCSSSVNRGGERILRISPRMRWLLLGGEKSFCHALASTFRGDRVTLMDSFVISKRYRSVSINSDDSSASFLSSILSPSASYIKSLGEGGFIQSTTTIFLRIVLHNMKIIIIFMTLHGIGILKSSVLGQWREEQHQQRSLVTETFINEYDEIPQKISSWNNMIFDQPMEPRKRVDITITPRPEELPCIRLVTRSACSCESQYEIKDLGEGYYPRYLTESRCKPKTCQSKFHSCKLLYYVVHILTEREPKVPQLDEVALQETPLPDSLRHKWQLKPMSVAVACVSNSVNRRT